MSDSRTVTLPVYLGVLLVSAVALGLEILLTRVLALMMWHHFTYVVIGVALLGFGAAGSHVMVRAAREDENEYGADSVERRLTRYSLGLAVAVPLAYLALIHVRFAPLSLREDPKGAVALLLIYVLIALPFYFAGLAICEAIRAFPQRVGSIYFVDLVGAGIGAILSVALMERLTGPGAILVFGAFGGIAAACFALARPTTASLTRGAAGLAVAAATLIWLVPPARAGDFDPPLAPTKELAMMPSSMTVSDSIWNPLARIDVTEAAVARPAMGGAFPAAMPQQNIRGIFQDGSAPTLFLNWDGKVESLTFLREASAAAGHVALAARGTTKAETMAIGVGGGIDLMIALQFGVERVTGVEINSSTLRLLEETYAEFSGGLAARDDVELVHAEGRHFARSSGREFDLIQLSGVDTYTALSSGAYTLSESYLYTVEAIDEFLDALKPGGFLSYSRIVFPERPRETLRLAATAIASLERAGIPSPADHVFVFNGGSWAELVVSMTPLEDSVLEALRGLAERNSYTVLFDPANPLPNAFADCLTSTPDERDEFFSQYPFLVRPATDNRPFFFNYFKWKDLRRTAEYGGHAYALTYPVGHLCLLLSLLQTMILGAFFILRPLRKLDRVRSGDGTVAAFLFFAALGIGFIAIEIVLLQRFVLFLGHPTRSLATVLPTLLIAAGLGSLTVHPATDARRRIRMLAVLVPVVALVGWLVANILLDRLLGLGFAWRVTVAATLLFPIGFVLGMAFPCGVKVLDECRPELVPWAWAVNAFTTVLGSTATVLLAMEIGFSNVMLAAVPFYVVGIVVLLKSFPSAHTASVSSDTPGSVVP